MHTPSSENFTRLKCLKVLFKGARGWGCQGRKTNKELIVRAKYRSPSIATGKSRSTFCTTSVSHLFLCPSRITFTTNSLPTLPPPPSLSLFISFTSHRILIERTSKYLCSNGKPTSFLPSFFLFPSSFLERGREGERERERESGFPGASNFHEVTDLRTWPTINKSGRVTTVKSLKKMEGGAEEGKGRANEASAGWV